MNSLLCFSCLNGFHFAYQPPAQPTSSSHSSDALPVPLREAELPAGVQPWQSLSNAACAGP